MQGRQQKKNSGRQLETQTEREEEALLDAAQVLGRAAITAQENLPR